MSQLIGRQRYYTRLRILKRSQRRMSLFQNGQTIGINTSVTEHKLKGIGMYLMCVYYQAFI